MHRGGLWVSLAGALVAPFVCCGSAFADDSAAASGASKAELAAIMESSKAFVAAFDRGDAKAVAALWTEDGEYVDEAGSVFRGRQAIEQEYARFFAENPGAKLKMVVDSLRLLGPQAAIEDGHASLDPPPPGAPGAAKYSAVHVKQGDAWLMASVRDTRIDTPSAYGQLADLEWMIGSWSAEENGATMNVTCRWLANKNFLERRFSVTRDGAPVTSGVQVVGWNGAAQRIQSWIFTSDGGHALGVWEPIDQGWAVHTEGMTLDGTITTAVNVLRKLSDEALSWQSIDRTVAGTPVADADEYILKRAATN